MYKRIVLAYDGSLEGRIALREGAMMAKRTNAQVHLLSVVSGTPGVLLAEGAYAGAMGREQESYRKVLEDGVEKLKSIGMDPVAKLVVGEPAAEIGAYAKKIGADLVVVGHRKLNIIERWWSGSVGANLVDYTACSLLISRNTVSEEDFRAVIYPAEKAVENG